MSEKDIIEQYLNINDCVTIYDGGSEPVTGLVREIDEYFLHLETENIRRLFRLSKISSFSVIKKYNPNENDIDREAEHIGRINLYDSKKLTGSILDMTDGFLQRHYFFHLNHISNTEVELRNLLLVDAWSGVMVRFHLGFNDKGICAKEITLLDQTELEYSPDLQFAQIHYYANSGKRGTLYIEEKKWLIPFHIGQVSSQSLANALMMGRWKGKKVQFYLAYNGAMLCADDIQEREPLLQFDTSQHRCGSVVECISSKKFVMVQIEDEMGNRFTARQQDIADLRLYTLVKERWNFKVHPCRVLFLTSDDNFYAKGVILDEKDYLEQEVRDQIEHVMDQWQYIALPHKPTPLSELPDEMVESAVFRRVRSMNENGLEDSAFELLEQYKDKLDSVKKKNWEIVLAAHSKKHDEKLFELLKEDDQQTIEDDIKLTDSEKSVRATRLEILRDAYYRQGDVKRRNEMDDRVEILRFHEDTGIDKRCTTEVKTVEQNLKKLLCRIMPEIWTTMYPDGKGTEKILNWEEGYLFNPPDDYTAFYNNRKRYTGWINSHKKKYGVNVSLQAVLSLKDTVDLINHYLDPLWYQRWYAAEKGGMCFSEESDQMGIPCFRDIFKNEWEKLESGLQVVTNERDRLNHADVNQDPRQLLKLYRETLQYAKEINDFFARACI